MKHFFCEMVDNGFIVTLEETGKGGRMVQRRLVVPRDLGLAEVKGILEVFFSETDEQVGG